MGFTLKPWEALVVGFPGHTPVFYASTRGKALAAAWSAYLSYDSRTSFRDFLKIARVRRTDRMPRGFGEPINVSGRPAFMVEVEPNGGNIRFVYEGEDRILLSHPLDVSRRPSPPAQEDQP